MTGGQHGEGIGSNWRNDSMHRRMCFRRESDPVFRLYGRNGYRADWPAVGKDEGQ
jgi:hypothetical protein